MHGLDLVATLAMSSSLVALAALAEPHRSLMVSVTLITVVLVGFAVVRRLRPILAAVRTARAGQGPDGPMTLTSRPHT